MQFPNGIPGITIKRNWTESVGIPGIPDRNRFITRWAREYGTVIENVIPELDGIPTNSHQFRFLLTLELRIGIPELDGIPGIGRSNSGIGWRRSWSLFGNRWNWFRERNWFRNVQHHGIGWLLTHTHTHTHTLKKNKVPTETFEVPWSCAILFRFP